MYKYSCRKCPIRNRCIEESDYTLSVKDMVRHAFGNRTDTLATWGLLQTNCLLIKAEEEQEERARKGTNTLTRRLREARQAREQAARDSGTGSLNKGKKSVIRRLPQARKAREEAAKARSQEQSASTDDEPTETIPARPRQAPDYLQPVSPSASSGDNVRPPTIGDSDPDLVAPPTPAPQPSGSAQQPCWLTIKGTNRYIALPANGELVLGRFDASFGVPPDIDLAFEDKEKQSISRRHAKIVGRNGYHSIEDTGSRHGVVVNEEKIKPGFSHQLKVGDRIAMGSVNLVYQHVSPRFLEISNLADARHRLIITPTGRVVPITPPGDIVIGRSDRYGQTVPDIDLSEDGQVSSKVSRRHAVVHWQDNQPHLEDLGSGFGTRINGKMVLLGQSVPLKPGDHIWLGGCVLAYEVEL